MSRPRDSQRNKLYLAERALWVNAEEPDKKLTISEMQTFVNRLVASAWFQRRYPGVLTIEVTDGRARRSAAGIYHGWAHSGEIRMPRWSRNHIVMLHEVAHVCVDSTKAHHAIASHGREFAATFIELVDHCLGKETGRVLRSSFRERGVKWCGGKANGKKARVRLA